MGKNDCNSTVPGERQKWRNGINMTAVSTLLTFCPTCPPERIVSYTMSSSYTSGSEIGSMNSTPTNQFLRGWPGR